MSEPVEIYTDGACSGNPGPGGWGAILSYKGQVRELSGAENETTNNRMELMATICALEALKRPSAVKLFTDSQYVFKGITEWLANWKRRGWKTASRKAVLNQDLWQRLDAISSEHEVEFVWVKGHSGVAGNERADELARIAIQQMLQNGDNGGSS